MLFNKNLFYNICDYIFTKIKRGFESHYILWFILQYHRDYNNVKQHWIYIVSSNMISATWIAHWSDIIDVVLTLGYSDVDTRRL